MKILVIFVSLIAVTWSQVQKVPSSYKDGTKWELFGDGSFGKISPLNYYNQEAVVKPYKPVFYDSNPVTKSTLKPFPVQQQFLRRTYNFPKQFAQHPVNNFKFPPETAKKFFNQREYIQPKANYGYHYEKPVYKYNY